MAIPSNWKEVNSEKISSLCKSSKIYIVETDDIQHAIKSFKSLDIQGVYFYRSDERKIDGVNPYYKIVAVL